MKKKIFAFVLTLITICSATFANVDIEVPLHISGAYTEIPLDDHPTYTIGFPYYGIGPIRGVYIFENDSPFTFGVGGSVIIWPIETICASGYVGVDLYKLKNGGKIELADVMDLGVFLQFDRIYNVKTGKKTVNCEASYAFNNDLNIYYRSPAKSGFYAGFGFGVSSAEYNNSVFFIYSLNTSIGFRIKTK